MVTRERDPPLERRGGRPRAPLARRVRSTGGALGRARTAAQSAPRGAGHPLRVGPRAPSPCHGTAPGARASSPPKAGSRSAGGATAPARGQHPPPPLPSGRPRPRPRGPRPRRPDRDGLGRRPDLRPRDGRRRMGREAPPPSLDSPRRGRRSRRKGRGRDAQPRLRLRPTGREPPLVPAARRRRARPGGHLRRAPPALRRRAARRARGGLPHRAGALVLPPRADPAAPPRARRGHSPRRLRIRGAHRARPPRRHGALPGRRPPALHRARAGVGAGGARAPRARGPLARCSPSIRCSARCAGSPSSPSACRRLRPPAVRARESPA